VPPDRARDCAPPPIIITRLRSGGNIRSAASGLEVELEMERSAPIARELFAGHGYAVTVIRNYRDDLMARPCAPNPRRCEDWIL
jgi:hypothetical protein